MPDPGRLADAARALLPAGVAVAAADPCAPPPPLLPGEAIPGAVDKRRREFAAGRDAVHRAMQALDLPPVPVPMGADRAPHWPQGLTGSITHTDTACLAAVTPQTVLWALGLDLETDTPLPRDLWDSVLLPAEILDLPRDPAAAGAEAKLVFSAKEAAYKAQYMLSRQIIGFDALRVRRVGADRFTAAFQDSCGPFAREALLQGRHARLEGHVLTVVSI
jgi:4'-phosphopantetheinyl transferase EntD